MFGNSCYLSILANSVQIDVTLGNNVQVTVLGKCTISILTKQGESKFIPNVYHVEETQFVEHWIADTKSL